MSNTLSTPVDTHTRSTPIARHTVAWGLLAVLFVVIAAGTSAVAQGPYPVTALDSVERVRDSTLTFASLAVSRDSTLIDEFQKIVQVYKERKQHRLQLEAAERMKRANPASARAYFAHGDALLDNGQPQLALEPLGKALLINPTFVRARIALSETYAMLGAKDTAIFHLDTALGQNGRNADAHMRRAALLRQLGREHEAIENYRAASVLLPQNAKAWYNLGDLLLKYDSPAEAAEVLEYAVGLDPMSATTLLRYADARMRAGHHERAIEAYTEFIMRFPTDARALEVERIARELGWRP